MITEDGLSIIKYCEGLKLSAYQDSTGIWTIGYGHTKNVKPNDIITEDDAEKLLKTDLADAELRVKNAIGLSFKNFQLDALISQAFNLKSFEVLTNHLKNSEGEYLRYTLLYCHDTQGHDLMGLKKRRVAEVLRFLGETWEQIKKFMPN